MGTCTRSTRICGFVLILGLGLCLFRVPPVSGQSTGSSLASLRVLVTSNVARGCGSGILSSAIQEAAAVRLTYVGMTVSNIHNARLSLDLDCAAIAPIHGNKSMAVQECLTFYNFVSPNAARPAFTSSWRRCRSYTCDRKCEAVAERNEARLIGDFLGDLWERSPDSMPPRKNQGPSVTMAASNSFQDVSPPGSTTRSTVLGAYILTCISVLVYWQFRNRGSWY
jgi:hypothetical protein